MVQVYRRLSSHNINLYGTTLKAIPKLFKVAPLENFSSSRFLKVPEGFNRPVLEPGPMTRLHQEPTGCSLRS